MNKSLWIVTMIMAFVVSSFPQAGRVATVTHLSQVKRPVMFDTANLIDRAAHRRFARDLRRNFGPLMIQKVPMVCDDNWRFCTAGCGSNDETCWYYCWLDYQDCILILQ